MLDLNGTTTRWGKPDDGVPERLEILARHLQVHLLSADTYGTLDEVAASLGVLPRTVANGDEKRAAVVELGADSCVAIGNGVNDGSMLRAAKLGIAVLGGEGVSGSALQNADVFCGSMIEALDLLLDRSGLAATLRP